MKRLYFAIPAIIMLAGSHADPLHEHINQRQLPFPKVIPPIPVTAVFGVISPKGVFIEDKYLFDDLIPPRRYSIAMANDDVIASLLSF